jgi:hypothetical protein
VLGGKAHNASKVVHVVAGRLVDPLNDAELPPIVE